MWANNESPPFFSYITALHGFDKATWNLTLPLVKLVCQVIVDMMILMLTLVNPGSLDWPYLWN